MGNYHFNDDGVVTKTRREKMAEEWTQEALTFNRGGKGPGKERAKKRNMFEEMRKTGIRKYWAKAGPEQRMKKLGELGKGGQGRGCPKKKERIKKRKRQYRQGKWGKEEQQEEKQAQAGNKMRPGGFSLLVTDGGHTDGRTYGRTHPHIQWRYEDASTKRGKHVTHVVTRWEGKGGELCEVESGEF